MAKKGAAKKAGAGSSRARERARAVRLDLTDDEHGRLQAAADRLGLSLASCARMAVLGWLRDQEGEAPGRAGK